jgi:hypothetical protein
MAAKDVLYGNNTSYTSHGNIGSFSDTNSPGSSGSTLDTGDLRRKFNFGDRVSELALAQDPFFRFVSMVSKKPTDDPQFKFTEKRGSYHKRYAYVLAHGTTAGGVGHGAASVDTGDIAVGDTYYFKMGADYKSAGNVQNIHGNYSFAIGSSGTRPEFFMEGQLVKIPFQGTANATTAAAAFAGTDYIIGKVTSVTNGTDDMTLGLEIVRTLNSTSNNELGGWGGNGTQDNHPGEFSTDELNALTVEQLEGARCYVVGTTFDKGTGYPETWKDQPFSTGYGQTQIWKTSMAMDNTDRATSLRYEGDEWARIWKEKLVEHKWDIEQSLLFGSQSDNYRTTQGAVDWILNNGNAFTLDTATKTQDDFLDDMSALLDPRYNNSTATVFFCSTDVYNWLHKLGGYFNNNLSVGSNFNADMVATAKKNVMGLGVTTISTVYGDMNVVRNIHLDGTNIKILGVNMKYCAYRPLVGNGINRDTSVYVGVQTLENSGVDRRVDQILTEAGMEWSMPECHAIWKKS